MDDDDEEEEREKSRDGEEERFPFIYTEILSIYYCPDSAVPCLHTASDVTSFLRRNHHDSN
jgi:hypothetical protein